MSRGRHITTAMCPGEELLGRTPYPAPRLRLDPAVTDFYAFTPDSVQLENYRYHP